ncbi:OmpH family outer membrane protein [Paraflavisolibacter sp. H34]|uniref:OmpH family outer membrane protein n=1 Tax=Huijunlia imazamoxiresistens TaxID=3127457 RepID=UPI0030197187
MIGILFYLHFSSPSSAAAPKSPVRVSAASPAEVPAAQDFRIAYFEMDSIEDSFGLVKDVKRELNRKDEQINNEKVRLRKMYQEKVNSYQQSAATMNQVQSEAATRDIMQMEENIKTKMQTLDQEFQDLSMRKTREVKNKIEEYLKEYNKDKGFSYILVNEPGLIFYKDSAYNITADVIKGLNESYGKKK